MNSINFRQQLRQSMQHARDASNRALRSLCCRSIDTIDTPYNNNTPALPLPDTSKQLSSSSSPSSISQPYQTISGSTPHYSEDSVGTSVRQNLRIENPQPTQTQNDNLPATLGPRVNEASGEENSVRQHAVPQPHNSDGLNLEATKIQRLFRGNLVRNAIRQKRNAAANWLKSQITKYGNAEELLFEISNKPSIVPEDLSLPLVLKSLIKDFYVNVNAKYSLLNFTPLHAASQFGNLAIAKSLIEHKADVNATDNKGNTPLHLAIRYGHLGLANLLINHGADVNAKNKNGETPLHHPKNIAAAQLLIDHRADVNATDKHGTLPLYKFYSSSELYEIGGPIEMAGGVVKAPLNYAYSNLSTAGNVAAKDNNIFTSNKKRNNPLLRACSRGNVSTIKLFARFSNVNDCNEDGETPLHAAAQSGHVAAVSELVRLGAKINTTNNNGETPLDIATKNKHDDVVKVLKEYGA